MGLLKHRMNIVMIKEENTTFLQLAQFMDVLLYWIMCYRNIKGNKWNLTWIIYLTKSVKVRLFLFFFLFDCIFCVFIACQCIDYKCISLLELGIRTHDVTFIRYVERTMLLRVHLHGSKLAFKPSFKPTKVNAAVNFSSLKIIYSHQL